MIFKITSKDGNANMVEMLKMNPYCSPISWKNVTQFN